MEPFTNNPLDYFCVRDCVPAINLSRTLRKGDILELKVLTIENPGSFYVKMLGPKVEGQLRNFWSFDVIKANSVEEPYVKCFANITVGNLRSMGHLPPLVSRIFLDAYSLTFPFLQMLIKDETSKENL